MFGTVDSLTKAIHVNFTVQNQNQKQKLTKMLNLTCRSDTSSLPQGFGLIKLRYLYRNKVHLAVPDRSPALP